MKKRGNFATVACISFLVLFVVMGLLFYFTHRPAKLKLGNEAAILGKFVDEALLPGYLPQQLTVEHRRTLDGTLTGANYTYGAAWSVGEVRFTAFLDYSPDLTRVDEVSVLVDLGKKLDLDQAKAHELLTTYFRNVGELKCGDLGMNYVCENSVLGKDKNSGFLALTVTEVDKTFLSKCNYFKGSEMFQWGSCVNRNETK